MNVLEALAKAYEEGHMAPQYDDIGCDFDFETFEHELEARGYVVVPKEPTEEMVSAAHSWADFVLLEETHPLVRGTYRAAIAARPRVGGDDGR